jgi:hypothetical protein
MIFNTAAAAPVRIPPCSVLVVPVALRRVVFDGEATMAVVACPGKGGEGAEAEPEYPSKPTEPAIVVAMVECRVHVFKRRADHLDEEERRGSGRWANVRLARASSRRALR